MMRNHFIAIAALVSAGALTLNAQTPQTPTPQTPQQQQQRPSEPRTGDTTQRPGQAATAQNVTITGCLKDEKGMPGQRANMAEKAGVGEDYFLTNVKMAQSSATSGIGLATAYEIDGLGNSELQKHVNHQVEITGTLDRGNAQGNRGAAAAPGSAASANADLPKIQATAVKMIAATCEAK